LKMFGISTERIMNCQLHMPLLIWSLYYVKKLFGEGGVGQNTVQMICLDIKICTVVYTQEYDKTRK
jgi:hypothetical protein